MNVLSIDIGTSTLKSALINSHHGILESFDVNYFDYFSVDFENFDYKIWFFAFKRVVSNFREKKIDCISISGISPCLIALGSDLTPLEVLHWNSSKIVDNFQGKSAFLPFVLSTLERGIYDKVRYFVSCFEYFIYLLTGNLITSYPSLSYIPFIWNDIEIREYNLDTNKFPPFLRMGESVGCVTTSASSEFGIDSGIEVINAGMDYLSVLVGSGAFFSGIVSNRTGTSEGFNFVSDACLPGFSLVYPYFLDNLFVIGRIVPSGYLLQLLKDRLFKNKKSFEEFLKEISKVCGLGNVCFYPNNREVFSDSIVIDSQVRGNLNKGIFGKIDNPLQIGVAILESSYFSFYNRILQLKSIGRDVVDIFVSGSNSNNLFLTELKANIIGRDLKIFEFKHSELIGNAILAFCCLGEFDSLDKAFKKIAKFKQVIFFSASIHELYLEKYHKYVSNFNLFVNG
ncbi:FGGY-family carbohydrate kinase [Borrelia anserina]|uniref:Xylulose kinase n=2 Tax=Borrelia anserina TaxID=143 RepID=W5SU11_BORAN|nr:FGGY-family carbohydrate kinase [Borrelia anserina]AHH08521.1 Xylulose kinase [Borrelia anserina BA2]APR64990.1 xylulose kinase [Borrelia anserina Es]UPA06913.1 FGGY-family carbohydrate kinase [Borrelia anserina]